MVMRISGAHVDTGQSIRIPADTTVSGAARPFAEGSRTGSRAVSEASGIEGHPGRVDSPATEHALSDRTGR
jgi:hypothetical protein